MQTAKVIRSMKVNDLLDLFSNRCKVYDLEQVRYPGMPAFDPVQPGLLYFLYRHHENYYKPKTAGPRSSASGLIVMSDQSGTHIDALCHQASDMTLQGRERVSPDTETPWGFTKGGAEELPAIIAKGVLADVASHIGDPLPEEHLVSLEEFKGALARERVNVGRGDVVFVRTGYGRFWKEPERYKRAAGVSREVSLLLREKGVLAVGSDNLAWDMPHAIDPATGGQLPGHLMLLAQGGVYIIENLNLEQLSGEKTYEFVFIGLPLKFKGATGSPMRPLALKPL